MKKGSGFVYPASGARSGAKQKRGAERARLQFERVSSPRKRKRSPESPPGPRPFSDKRQPSPAADQLSEDDTDDIAYELAALEDYEATQRTAAACTSAAPTETKWRGTTPSGALPTGTQQAGQVVIPAAGQIGTRPIEGTAVWGGSGNAQASATTSSIQLGERGFDTDNEVQKLRSELSEKASKLGELQEEGYKRDGEVKLLRTELKKKEDQLHEMHVRFVSEQKQKEDQFVRETKSLSAQLEFNEQELAALRERCSNLEQRHKQQLSVTYTSPVPHSRLPQKHTPTATQSGQKSKPPFLSTETFMPLSQMGSSDITPVHVAHVSKRGSQQHQEPTSGSSKSVSPEVVKRVASRQASPTPSSSGVKSTRKPKPTSNPSTGPPKKTTDSKGKSRSCTPTPSDKSRFNQPIYLSVPPVEVSSGELLMLLAQQDLLKVPSFKDTESKSTSDSTEEGSNIQTLLDSAASSSLPGLFSLLHIPRTSSSSSHSMPFSSATTPMSSRLQPATPSSEGASLSMPPSLESNSDSLPKTPIRKSRLQLHKPHTCARTDMSRSRTQGGLDDFPLRKALSASNTPIREMVTPADGDSQEVSQSLLSSIDVESLTGSIISMLKEGDSSTVLSMMNQSGRSHLAASTFTSSVLSHSTAQRSSIGRGGDGPGVEIQILVDLGDVVQHYVTEQTERVRASIMSTASNTSNLSDLDSLDTLSPRSSYGAGTGSSASSRNSSDANEPSKADQSIVYRSLSVLETLLTYSQRARDQLTAPQPPMFMFEDETASGAVETKLSMAQRMNEMGDGEGEEEGDKMEEEEGREEIKTPTVLRSDKPKTILRKGIVLEQYGTGPFSKVWIPRTDEQQSDSSTATSWRRRSTSVPLSVTPYGRGAWDSGDMGERRRERKESNGGGRRGRQLFSSLLRLVSPPWKESNEVILLSLKLLSIVAHDCPVEQLERFSPLLDRDGLDTYLSEDPPIPSLCLASLTLLTHLTNSPQLTCLLCSPGATSESCLLQICYEYFTRVITEDSRLMHKIRVQLVRLVSNISVVAGGAALLFESSCDCCTELLKSVVTLIQHLVEDACFCEDISHSNTMLLCSLITLLHKISLSDRYFDSHRESCKYTFAYALRRLKLLFKDSKTMNNATKYILSELYLEFCDDETVDTSGNSCDDEETQMTE